jgi:hypothetical protein
LETSDVLLSPWEGDLLVYQHPSMCSNHVVSWSCVSDRFG